VSLQSKRDQSLQNITICVIFCVTMASCNELHPSFLIEPKLPKQELNRDDAKHVESICGFSLLPMRCASWDHEPRISKSSPAHRA
jgi:hypothetical protein